MNKLAQLEKNVAKNFINRIRIKRSKKKEKNRVTTVIGETEQQEEKNEGSKG